MTQIQVPVVNENPDTITDPIYNTEYAVSFGKANPDGVPGDCQVGGPGVLGGPEYVTFLQRDQLDQASIQKIDYRYETFELVQYPEHTFYSFKNFETGKKSVVAFKNGQAVVTDVAPIITVATYITTGDTHVATASSMPGTYTWAIGGGGAVASGQGTNSITWTDTGVGAKTLTCSFVNSLGLASPAATPAVSTAVAAPTAVGVITSDAVVTAGVANIGASVVAQAGMTYSWTCSDGTITSGGDTNSIRYTAGTVGTNNINCHVVNLAGTSAAATQKVVSVIAAPAATAITIGASVAHGASGLIASVPAQSGMTYAWTMSNGTITSASTIASITYTAGIAGSNNVNCTISNAATTPATAAAPQIVQTVT